MMKSLEMYSLEKFESLDLHKFAIGVRRFLIELYYFFEEELDDGGYDNLLIWVLLFEELEGDLKYLELDVFDLTIILHCFVELFYDLEIDFLIECNDWLVLDKFLLILNVFEEKFSDYFQYLELFCMDMSLSYQNNISVMVDLRRKLLLGKIVE